MIEFSTAQIIPPTNTRRFGPGEARDLVATDAGAFDRRPLFAHSGNAAAGARQSVSAPFLAQHLDQEWIQRHSPADSRLAANAYAHAALPPAPRRGLATAA